MHLHVRMYEYSIRMTCVMIFRQEYMKSLLRQDMAWHDTHRAGEAVARLAEATTTMANGMEKFPTMLKSICTLIVGIVIGFVTSWKVRVPPAPCPLPPAPCPLPLHYTRRAEPWCFFYFGSSVLC
jgi:ABC-type multidrug transport system fused ATPase/permease subunit